MLKNLLNNHHFQFFAKNSTATLISYFFTALFTFLITYIIANYLEPHVTGAYRYVYSYYAIIAAIALAGMNSALTKSIAAGYDATYNYAIQLKKQFSVYALLISFIIAIYYFLNNNYQLFWGFIALGVSLPIFEISMLILSYLQGKEKFWDMAKFSIISKFLVFVLTCVSVFILPYVFSLIILTILLVGIFQYYYAKKIIKNTNINQISNIDYGFKKYSLHLSGMNLIYIIGAQADKLITFTLFGSIASAGYWIATIIPLEFQRMITSITSIYFPKLVRAEKNNIKSKLIKILSLATLLMIFISIIYNFFAPFIFQIFFPKYLNYIQLSQIAFWNICFIPFAFIWSYFLAKGHLKIMYFLHVFDPLIQIFLYFILVPTFGILGLIYGMLIKGFLFNVFAIVLFLRK